MAVDVAAGIMACAKAPCMEISYVNELTASPETHSRNHPVLPSPAGEGSARGKLAVASQ